MFLSIYLPIMSNPCWGPRHSFKQTHNIDGDHDKEQYTAYVRLCT